MKQIFQFVHTLNYGDAISGEAIAIKRLLESSGIVSEIFSVHDHEMVEKETRSWREYKSLARGREAESVLLLHYSIASPLNQLVLDARDVKKALVYHNLTPVSWFSTYNARVAADLEKGFSELPMLLPGMDLVLADSEFNRRELESFGCHSARVLPLLFDADKWSVAANAGIAGVLRGHGGKNILHVGRLAPNKCIEDILKVFYFYHHKINQQSRLWLVGSDIDTEIYSFELRRLVSELRLKEDVTFVGAVSDGELKAFYENADAYLCMSEHEGFCVPLLEAMQFGVPVIAFGACAVPETLGDGGVLLGRKDPALAAELLNRVLSDQALRKNLIGAGKKRVMAFSEEVFRNKLEENLLCPLGFSIGLGAV